MARKKVTSVPALADWGAVDNALRDIRECQHTLAEMAVQRDRQIDSIKADYAQGALPLQNRVKALESEVKAYVDLHRAELDGKGSGYMFDTEETPPPYATGTGRTAMTADNSESALRKAMGLPME